jgi:hypothetical protein
MDGFHEWILNMMEIPMEILMNHPFMEIFHCEWKVHEDFHGDFMISR